MKIIYCIHGTFNSGGMERILANKAIFLSRHGHQVVILTTEQKGREPFLPLPKEVRAIDLGINYSETSGHNVFARQIMLRDKRRKHKELLQKVLMDERADIVVSMYSTEMPFLPYINDGSRKILEIHFAKSFHTDMMRSRHGNNLFFKAVAKYRSKRDNRHIKAYDRFVVLTDEDRKDWGDSFQNIISVPNFIGNYPDKQADYSSKRVICVGRHNYQKGMDFLIETWSRTAPMHPDWKLAIVGGGEDMEKNRALAEKLGVSASIDFIPPTKHIAEEYLKSSIYVMSSRYEGLPMVLIEAMSCGLPCVSFACKCGPKDIISDGKNGLLIDRVGDTEALSMALSALMSDEALRQTMGKEAQNRAKDFSEEKIMSRWMTLFDDLRQ